MPDFDDPESDNDNNNSFNQLAQQQFTQPDKFTDNPLAATHAQIHKNEQKKDERLAKNTWTDIVPLMISSYVRDLGCDGDPVKRLLCILMNEKEFSYKMLKDLSPLIKSDRIQAIAILMISYYHFVKKNVKMNDAKYDDKMNRIETSYEIASGYIIKYTQFVVPSGTAKELYSLMSDLNVTPFQFHHELRNRLQTTRTKPRHSISDTFSFKPTLTCYWFNYMGGCYKKECELPSICAGCHDSSHPVTSPLCPMANKMPNTFRNRINQMITYHTKRKIPKSNNNRNNNNKNNSNVSDKGNKDNSSKK